MNLLLSSFQYSLEIEVEVCGFKMLYHLNMGPKYGVSHLAEYWWKTELSYTIVVNRLGGSFWYHFRPVTLAEFFQQPEYYPPQMIQ